MHYNPKYHHRRSIRLKGYDYAQAGLYFITVCCDRKHNPGWIPFGNIENGVLHLNDAGRMVEKWYYELEKKYPDKRCHEMVVMPNHVHFIIENVAMDKTDRYVGNGRVGDDDAGRGIHVPSVDGIANPGAHVGAPLRGRPVEPTNERGHPVNQPTDRGRPVPEPTERGRPVPEPTNHEHPAPKPNDNRNIPPYGPDNKKYGATIGDAMDWFKTMTTNEYIRGVKTLGWPPFNKKLWQRNYYEHIIRDQQSYVRISEYIRNNPANWQDDKFFE